jgi:hypothetical protein
MKLLSLRARLNVFHLVLGAAVRSPRAARIAAQLATCGDTFLGALLQDWALVDPASHATEPPPAGLCRLARAMLAPPPASPLDAAAAGFGIGIGVGVGIGVGGGVGSGGVRRSGSSAGPPPGAESAFDLPVPTPRAAWPQSAFAQALN